MSPFFVITNSQNYLQKDGHSQCRLLFNNIFDWEERRSVKTNEKLIDHLWAPNLHFLSTEKLERISTLKNSGSVTIFRNGTVQFDSHVRITVGKTKNHKNLFFTFVFVIYVKYLPVFVKSCLKLLTCQAPKTIKNSYLK